MAQENKQDKVELWLNRVERFTSFLKAGFVYAGSTIGLFTAGLAPALTFGYSLYHALSGIEGWSSGLAKGAGISLAVTMEVVGSISAYVAQKSTNMWHKAGAVIILLAYTGIGLGYMFQFETNQTVRNISMVGYLVSLLVYVVVPLFTSTIEDVRKKTQEDEEAKQKALEDKQKALEADLEAKEATRLAKEAKQKQDEQDRLFELRKQEAQLKWQHEERIRQMEIKAQLDLEKVKAKQGMVSSRKDNGNLPSTYQDIGNDYRIISEKVKRTFIDFTVEEIVKNYNLSKKTAKRFKEYAIRDFTQLTVNGNGVHHE